ncbi:MAG: hypothetical protein U0457_18910 [Candidatus Sericytochromatia bacterium]
MGIRSTEAMHATTGTKEKFLTVWEDNLENSAKCAAKNCRG